MDENVKMDKKSKIFFVVLLIITLVSIGATYYRALVARDFEVFSAFD